MAFFQKSVLKSYLNKLDQNTIDQAYYALKKYQNKSEEISSWKEEEYQGGFLNDVFVNVFGYKSKYDYKDDFNLVREKKNETNSKKADGAILKNNEVFAIIELKGTDTRDLDPISIQAFGYKNNHKKCKYVITSNFEKLRLYINTDSEHIEWNLFNINREDFETLWLCLSSNNFLNDLPVKLKEESVFNDKKITEKLYKDYSAFRKDLFDSIKLNNNSFDELVLFNKTQKLLDRFLFIFFAEDRLLVPANAISSIINKWEDDESFGKETSLYDTFKIYFNVLDKGREAKGEREEIFAYNGGLFAFDNILDAITIDNKVLHRHTKKLSEYDFESEVSVNILGHIFENSLTEIEEIQKEIEGIDFSKEKSKRKKDGVFYTPQYITKYIVENSVGKLCREKKELLGIVDLDYAKGRKNRKKDTIRKLDQNLEDYRDWLLNITICDPACGSGAFLIQALNFLIDEHKYIDELKAQLFNSSIVFQDVSPIILEKNLYGVDINRESIDIAKLSLWLRTAQKGRKLTSLNNNIKCGNSLIDDFEIAGDKNFKWKEQFPSVFKKGGFDIVIGNPPYVTFALGAKQSHDDNIVDHLKTKYPLASAYKVSSYLIFLQVGLELLNNDGILSYIIPNTYHTNYFYREFRHYLIDNYHIEELLDVRYKVFEDAEMGFTSIPFIRKDKIRQQTSKLVRVFDVNEFNSLNYFKIDQEKFKIFPDTKFLFQLELMSIWNKAQTNSSVLGDVQKFKFYNGTKTGNNSKFLVDSAINDLCKPVLRGKDFYKYEIRQFEKYIIFDKEALWSNVADENFIVPEKLLIRRTSDHLALAYDDKKSYVLDTVHILYSLSDEFMNLYILGVLNSKLFNLLYRLIVPEGGKAFAEVKISNLKKLPIKNTSIEFQNTFSKCVLLIQNLSNDQYVSTNRFTKYLQSQFSIEKLPKKLQNWHELEFGDFIKELNKAIAKTGLEKLTKMDEIEWMEVFETKKAEAQTLKAEIDKIDREIDEMVYELYGLTQEEIKVVEES